MNVDDPFFYSTVETVQGKQTMDLYLSMTYTGRSSLNQNELGSQVFNVAVSRATDSVTVIHSVKPEMAKPDYVKQYLEIVDHFSDTTENRFVSGKAESNFAMVLGDYISEHYGISKDRLLFDYGATDGSVRIPLVILSPDKTIAQLGVFYESVLKDQYNYVDYHVRYYDILHHLREWNLCRVFLHDWIEHPEGEQKLLDEAIRKCVSM